jgi:hypothetical protein
MGSRPRVLAVLAGFVVTFGFVSLLVTGAIGRVETARSSNRVQSAPPVINASPRASPITLRCNAAELAISGAVNDCATEGAARSCSVVAHRLEATIILSGAAGELKLSVEADGNYNGPGIYGLPAWPHPTLDTSDDVAKVAISDAGTAGQWHSVSGEVTIDAGGRSGFIAATLELVGGEEPPPSQPGMFVEGIWSC